MSILSRETFKTVLAEFMPGIARKAVSLTPDRVREALDDHTGFIRLLLPLASTGVGVILSKVMGKAVPDSAMASLIQEYFSDVRADFMAEYGRALRDHGHAAPPEVRDQVKVIFPPPGLVTIDPKRHATQYHHRDCADLRRNDHLPARPAQGDRPAQPEKNTPRTDLVTMRLEQARGGAYRPATCCHALFEADDLMYAQRALDFLRAMPRPVVPALSLTAFVGRLARNEVKGVSKAKAKLFIRLIGRIPEDEVGALFSEITNESEFVGLLEAKSVPVLRRLARAAKDPVIEGRIAQLLGVTPTAVKGAFNEVKKFHGHVSAFMERKADEYQEGIDKQARRLKKRPDPKPNFGRVPRIPPRTNWNIFIRWYYWLRREWYLATADY